MHPTAIWFWRTPTHHAHVAVVNDLYRYEIFENVTGHRIAMESFDTLADAKAAVLQHLSVIL